MMPFLHGADFTGRSSRTKFWTFSGLSIAVFLLVCVAAGLSAHAAEAELLNPPETVASSMETALILLFFFAFVALILHQIRSDRAETVEHWVSTPTPPVMSPSQTSAETVEHWVSTPTQLSAGGVSFGGYLVYFGTRAHDRQWRHRSLIDPDLKVSNGRDPQGSSFSYWPDYSELQPQARRSYLEWLSTGRKDPSTAIGYVFIYFYGLERRLIADRSKADAPAIMSELRRLFAIYGHNSSFKRYCSTLLGIGEFLYEDAGERPVPKPDTRYGLELPIRLRIYLGKKIGSEQVLDSDDVLCWTLSHPMLRPRIPVTRCFTEFCALWKIRFDAQFPTGLSVCKPKTRLKFQYHSASSDFTATVIDGGLPDIGTITGPISKFESLLNSCCDELEAFSSFLGRYPEEKESAIAGALLPDAIRKNTGLSHFGQFSEFLKMSTQQAGFAVIGVTEIMTKLGFPGAGTTDERRALHMKRLPALLDAAGFGFEPDKRFGPAPGLSDDLNLCVFTAERGGAVNASRPEYLAARTMVEIAALAARSDTQVAGIEIEAITSDIASFPAISELDRLRLRAHALAFLENPSKLRAVTNRLRELPETQRQAALDSAFRAVLADRRIMPSEVRFLEGLYKTLGLPQDEIYSRLHGEGTTPEPSGQSAKSSTQSSVQRAAGAEIDTRKLAQLMDETSEVSSLLASIFKEEDTPAKTSSEKLVTKTEFPGLDAAHSSVLVQLIKAPIESDKFEDICRELSLLPSGAIETINDWAFDTLDDYAIGEGELIHIQEHLVEQVRKMRRV